MHGVILPPFQLKTRFGYRVAAAELEGVGIRTIDVDGYQDIKINKAMLLQSRDEEDARWIINLLQRNIKNYFKKSHLKNQF